MATHKPVVQVLLLEEKMLYAKSQKYTTNNIRINLFHYMALLCNCYAKEYISPMSSTVMVILSFQFSKNKAYKLSAYLTTSRYTETSEARTASKPRCTPEMNQGEDTEGRY